MNRLAVLRTMNGLTQKDVAKAIGVTQGAISAWEQGRKKPTIDKLPLLAKLYKVSEQAVLSAYMDKIEERSSKSLYLYYTSKGGFG